VTQNLKRPQKVRSSLLSNTLTTCTQQLTEEQQFTNWRQTGTKASWWQKQQLNRQVLSSQSSLSKSFKGEDCSLTGTWLQGKTKGKMG